MDFEDDEFPLPVSLQESYQKNLLHSPPKIKIHSRTYSCQMNVSDTDVLHSILLNNTNMEEMVDELEADVSLTNTCAIWEHAEAKIWHRLRNLRYYDTKYPKRFHVWLKDSYSTRANQHPI
jgi:hypothetical protein